MFEAMRRRSASAFAACAAVLVSSRAHAVDPFEIQVYDGTLNPPGAFGVELHVNRVFSGLEDAEAPELPPQHQTHLTLEPSLGVLPWWEVGCYLQTTIVADDGFRYAGTKVRSKFVTPPGTFEHVRLGLNVELSLLPESFDPNQLGTELRPIAAYENDFALLAINPIVDVTYSGADAGLFFAPAAMAKLKLLNVVALGVEYYADLGPFFTFLPWSEQEHYLFEAVDLLAVPSLDVNLAVGQGLTDASNDFVGKMIIGYGTSGTPARSEDVARPSTR